MCCPSLQVVLLLKSSDRIAHDICHAFDACEAPPASAVSHTLALRQSYGLKPEREFRCFVRGHELVGQLACQIKQDMHLILPLGRLS